MKSNRHTVFAFAGLGLDPYHAAKDLFNSSQTYREQIAKLDAAIKTFYRSEARTQPFTTLTDYLLEDTTRPARNPSFGNGNHIERAAVAPPPTASLLIFAVQYALARVVQAEGVEPDSVVGYSIGDYVAAAVTGSLPLDTAVKLVLRQDEIFDDRELVAEEGAVLAVFQPLEKTFDVIKQANTSDKVDIAGFPRPNATIVGGSLNAVKQIQAECETNGISTRKTNLNLGMHSHHVQPIVDMIANDPSAFPAEDFTDACVKEDVRHWSTAFKKELSPGTPLDAKYWAANLRNPVHFEQCIRGIQDHNTTRRLIFLNMDMRPRPAPMIEQNLQGTAQWESGQTRAIGVLELPVDSNVGVELEEGWTWRALKQNLSKL